MNIRNEGTTKYMVGSFIIKMMMMVMTMMIILLLVIPDLFSNFLIASNDSHDPEFMPLCRTLLH